MARYLDTSHVSSELMDLIKEAKEKIILVTFSLQVNKQIQERLKTKSKIGTLSEISLIYGNTKLKQSELDWMSEIDDLKVWQKVNLHAKCYINENKAIITSMNLYDYSQTTNTEMGILITKKDDGITYEKMMEDIHDLKINGKRRRPWEETTAVPVVDSPTVTKQVSRKEKSCFSYRQQLMRELLEEYRKEMSIEFRQNSKNILSDKQIDEIATRQHELTWDIVKSILRNDKKLKQLGNGILVQMRNAREFTIGRILATRYEGDDLNYDQIKMVDIEGGKSDWYNTKSELPEEGQIVAVLLNKKWFNDYYILEATDTQEIPQVDESSSNREVEYKKTRELAEFLNTSSRKVNAALVSAVLMEKNKDGWLPTDRGYKRGAVERVGSYGTYVVWPEEIIGELDL